MRASNTIHGSPAHLRRRAAVAVVGLWLPYTLVEALYQTGRLAEPAALALQLGLGALAIAILLGSGYTRHDCFLRYAPLSWRGLIVLSLSGLLAAPILLSGEWTGWNPLAALVFAPTSALVQELYFRSTLLPALVSILNGRQLIALGGHALLFGLWHVGPLVSGAPLWAVLAVMAVPLLCGLAWGWQTQHDRSVVWALLLHTLLLILNSFYTWG